MLRRMSKRKERQYTQYDVERALLIYAGTDNISWAAKQAGVSANTLYNWVHGSSGKLSKYAERFKEIQDIKKSERNKQMSILLQLAFRGIVENIHEARFAELIRLWGIVMDKYRADNLVGTDAAFVLDKILTRDEYLKSVNKRDV